MAVLSDVRILEKIFDNEFGIHPLSVDNIQASSIDLTLDRKIRRQKEGTKINAFEQSADYFEEFELDKYTLEPGEFILGQIREIISIPSSLCGMIQNRNSVIRLGLNVGLSTYINPGYSGQLPIAIHNAGAFAIDLTPGMRICQLVLYDVSPVPERDYSQRHDSKYMHERDVQTSKLHLDQEFTEYLRTYNPPRKYINRTELQSFFESRFEEKAKAFIEQLSPDERLSIGLK